MSSAPNSALADPQQAILNLQRQLAERTLERDKALARETAITEVLQVINSSPGDLQPVFDAVLDKALELCGATFGHLLTWDGEYLNRVAARGASPDEALLQRYKPIPGSAGDRLLRGEDVICAADLREEDAYRAGSPGARVLVDRGGARSYAGVALRKDGELLGGIAIYRTEVRPFSEKEVALLQSFAAQALIAMENARLITETREALEQQTATAEVLQVINASPGELSPVFDAMLEKAMRLCVVAFGTLRLYDGERFHLAASRGASQALLDFQREPLPPGPNAGKMLRGEDIIYIPDIIEGESYKSGSAAQKALVELGGARSYLMVALRKEHTLLGYMSFYRQEVRLFSDKQIALLQNFAAQAVIAIENGRLINETREGLEQQTATAEVLGVINSSPGDLAPVFNAMLQKAVALCEAAFGTLVTYDGERYAPAAAHGVPAAFADFRSERGVFAPPVGSSLERVAKGENLVHLADVMLDPGQAATPLVRLGGARALVCIGLRKEETLLGAITVYRQEARSFSDKQIALLQNFAAQAVVAMENARLLGELRQRTEEVAELNRGLEARVAEQVDELGRVGRLKRFLAPQLAELIVSQGDENILESHRREIVVVFCDLRGYTAFTETAEPEEVLDFLREYHGALGPLVAQFEGTLDQFSGDGIMVFFNDPVPIPDPAERAVNMAIAMREAAGALIGSWRRRGRELGFGAGVAQGYATLGQIGFAERSGYTAIGTVCNLAARLCAEAKDGQILIAQRVAAAVDQAITLEEIGSLSLKGLTQPVVAYNVPVLGNQAAFRVIEGGAPNA